MKEYLKNLRKLVGHMPILVCGASVIVENENGEILLQLRKDNKCWGYPGGSVDINEVVEEAAKRELLEETGLIANTLELFGVFSGKELYYIYPHGDEISNVDIVYICKSYSGEVKADMVESVDVKFFDINELPDNISPPCVPALKKYQEIKGASYEYLEK
jgi:ADP-ribose pyrophosphatase YjhB (NUDIX family)